MLASTGSAVQIYGPERLIGIVKRNIFQTFIQFAVISSVLYQKTEMKLKAENFSL